MLWFGGPQLKMVKRLIIRRQLRRYVSPEGMECILSHLKRLEALWYEPWEPYKDDTRDVRCFYDGSTSSSAAFLSGRQIVLVKQSLILSIQLLLRACELLYPQWSRP